MYECMYIYIMVSYNISLPWNNAILGWHPLTIILGEVAVIKLALMISEVSMPWNPRPENAWKPWKGTSWKRHFSEPLKFCAHVGLPGGRFTLGLWYVGKIAVDRREMQKKIRDKNPETMGQEEKSQKIRKHLLQMWVYSWKNHPAKRIQKVDVPATFHCQWRDLTG